MERRSTGLMEAEACMALADALTSLGLSVLREVPIGNRRVDLLVESAGVELDVKTKPVITAGNGAEIARQDWRLYASKRGRRVLIFVTG